MKPACPIENCPVKPLMRLSETASITLIPHSIITWKKYGLSAFGRTRSSATRMTSAPSVHTTRFIGALDLLGGVPAEDAGGAHEQDEDQQDERDRVAVG